MKQKKIINKIPIYKIKNTKQLLVYYKDWANKNKYNKDMVEWEYSAPKSTVSILSKYVSNKRAKILDAGCGTGLVGIELRKKGYKNIDGVDFSENMLNLVPKGIYKNINKLDLNKKLKIKSNLYEIIICVGSFTFGHVKPNALNEMIRITKKNGLICFTINEGVYESYGFNKKIHELIKKNLWEIKELFKTEYIKNKNVSAFLCLAKKI